MLASLPFSSASVNRQSYSGVRRLEQTIRIQGIDQIAMWLAPRLRPNPYQRVIPLALGLMLIYALVAYLSNAPTFAYIVLAFLLGTVLLISHLVIRKAQHYNKLSEQSDGSYDSKSDLHGQS